MVVVVIVTCSSELQITSFSITGESEINALMVFTIWNFFYLDVDLNQFGDILMGQYESE